jgi:hypothetical protein
MVLLSEIVQTTILGDFCYHYVKRYSPMHFPVDQVDAYELEKRAYFPSLCSTVNVNNSKICLQLLLLDVISCIWVFVIAV